MAKYGLTLAMLAGVMAALNGGAALADSPYLRPNGDTPIGAVTHLRDLAVFEAETPVDGTYRLSSGPREGRTAKMCRNAEGVWNPSPLRGEVRRAIHLSTQ
ncbi:hypothetical protein GCM10009422_21020 [Brevundimonas kwangchunensis]|uniref:Uncharacterized protein n=1 Tax=Brevundimonas kwangchunensis TaxID=322163 RepID=A0ABN1GZD4_9CAUL